MILKKILSYISPQYIESVVSPINGNIIVEMINGKYRTSVNRYWQSGPYAEKIMQYSLKALKIKNKKIRNILILGFGGGSMVKILRYYFPDAYITGVEIDNKMIEIGFKYFNLYDYKNIKLIISDVINFLNSNTDYFDIVISDIFIGCESPISISTIDFANKIKNILNNNSIYISNYSNNKDHKKNTDIIIKKIKNIFTHIDIIDRYPNLIVNFYN